MMNPQFFEEISQSLLTLIPSQVRETEQALKESFRSLLMQAFSRLEFVNREEFDVQVKVLARTREKVEALHAQVEELVASQLSSSV